MENYDFLLSIYESEELSDMEKMALISIMEDANPEDDKAYDKLQRKIHYKDMAGDTAGKVKNTAAAISGAAVASTLVQANKFRKLNAELEKQKYLYQTAEDPKEKTKIADNIERLKAEMMDVSKRMKQAGAVGMTSSLVSLGADHAEWALNTSKKKDEKKSIKQFGKYGY